MMPSTTTFESLAISQKQHKKEQIMSLYEEIPAKMSNQEEESSDLMSQAESVYSAQQWPIENLIDQMMSSEENNINDDILGNYLQKDEAEYNSDEKQANGKESLIERFNQEGYHLSSSFAHIDHMNHNAKLAEQQSYFLQYSNSDEQEQEFSDEMDNNNCNIDNNFHKDNNFNNDNKFNSPNIIAINSTSSCLEFDIPGSAHNRTLNNQQQQNHSHTRVRVKKTRNCYENEQHQFQKQTQKMRSLAQRNIKINFATGLHQFIDFKIQQEKLKHKETQQLEELLIWMRVNIRSFRCFDGWRFMFQDEQHRILLKKISKQFFSYNYSKIYINFSRIKQDYKQEHLKRIRLFLHATNYPDFFKAVNFQM